MLNQEQITVLEKLANSRVREFTSREFDIAQTIFQTESIEDIAYRLQTNHVPGISDKFRVHFFSHNVIRNSYDRLDLSRLIVSVPKSNNDNNDDIRQDNHQLKVQSADEFFDLLFHQYKRSSEATPTNHHAFFIALVSQAQSQNPTDDDEDIFFTIGREALGITDNHSTEEKNRIIGQKTNTTYANIYYAIFKDNISNPAITYQIIQRLKTYTPTADGYRQARQEHLENYQRAPKTDAVATEKHSTFPQTEKSQNQFENEQAPPTPRADESKSNSQTSKSNNFFSWLNIFRSSKKENKQPQWITNLENNEPHIFTDETEFFDFLFPNNEDCKQLSNEERFEREDLYKALMTGVTTYINQNNSRHKHITDQKNTFNQKTTDDAVAKFQEKLEMMRTTHIQHKTSWSKLGALILTTLSQPVETRPEVLIAIIQNLQKHGYSSTKKRNPIKGYASARASYNNELMEIYIKPDLSAKVRSSAQQIITPEPTFDEKTPSAKFSLKEQYKNQLRALPDFQLREMANENPTDLAEEKLPGKILTGNKFNQELHKKRSIYITAFIEVCKEKEIEIQIHTPSPTSSPQRSYSNSASINSTPRNIDNHPRSFQDSSEPTTPSSTPTNVQANNNISTNSTSITTPAPAHIEGVTKELILKTLWGEKTGSDKPSEDSTCAKTTTLWKSVNRNITFIRPTEDSIKINDNNKDFSVDLSMQGDENKTHKLTLSRTVDENKQSQTWTCETTDDLLDEKMRLQLIAAESLALRKAQQIKNSDVIGIANIEDHSSKIQSEILTCSSKNLISLREEMIIQAHLDAGYKSVFYNGGWYKYNRPPISEIFNTSQTNSARKSAINEDNKPSATPQSQHEDSGTNSASSTPRN